ncbi:Intraflagellar transport protein 88 [Amphibalanus amphitrite]|nr:Intraflagellar transport protein 88 [Amphibalanus amphitrite]KAF0300601.1 Intraflagellar transport protein 88 [Amphibalanus amphitrite]
MMDNDDLYSGYDYSSAMDFSAMDDIHFQQAIKNSMTRRPMTQSRLLTGMGGSRPATRGQPRTGLLRSAAPSTASFRGGMPPMTGRPLTGMTSGDENRPMTAVKGVGYSSAGGRQSGFERGRSGLEPHSSQTPEERVRQLEARVMALVEESCLASCRNEDKLALDRAKEASAKERTLIRHREQAGLIDSHNLELTFVVLTNLAHQYAKNELYTEALNTYQVITKNKNFNNAGRLKVNMGNIYYKMGQFPKALKFYRMALDQIPSGQSSTKIKIMHNIGILFVKMGHFPDAITSFEFCMHEKPSFRIGLHLVVCYHAMGDRAKQKEAFQKLLQVPFDMENEDKYKDLEEEAEKDPQTSLVLEVIKNDPMRKLERRLRNEAEQCILTAAKLISSAAGEDSAQLTEAYDWCVDTLKNSQHSELANDLEINKAVMYLRQRDFRAAIDTLKVFDKVDTKVASHASTNLAFLFFLRKEYEEAEKYAERARDADGYNAPALVNLGNCCFQRGDLEKAKEYYICALDNDASCVQALYNLGLTNKNMRLYADAKDSFVKLHTIVRSHPQIIYQIANCSELMGDIDQATEWYIQMLSLVPSDPDTLFHLGGLLDSEGDKQAAYQYYFDSSRFYPANLEVIDWLGSYFIEHQVSEKAILYFERATLIQPAEVRWHLIIASCYRRAGNYQRALAKYKEIHVKFPDNIECLKFLVRICTDLGLKEAADYAVELKRAEKYKEMRDERLKSGRPSTSYRSGLHGSRDNSAASRRSDDRPGSMARPPGTAGERASLSPASPQPAPTAAATPTPSGPREIDASYSDPIGDPMAQRPRTAAFRPAAEDDLFDDELGDDLLPDAVSCGVLWSSPHSLVLTALAHRQLCTSGGPRSALSWPVHNDTWYDDPLGPLEQRMTHYSQRAAEDDWDDELGDDLLPE